MRILVTGANGYLGQGIISKILDNGHEVIATDLSVQYVDERAKKVSCNLFELENPYEFFEKPDAVLHLAWRDGFKHYSDAHVDDLPKHFMFIKKIVQSGIKKITVMGSMHEIGFFEGSIREDTPCHPLSLYGISKNALREITQLLAEQNSVKFQWLRGYYIVGNSSFGSSIFSKIAAAAGAGEIEFPFTLGQNQYDFIDYDVCCQQITAAIEQDEVLGIINICSGKPEKLADRVERFISKNQYDIKLIYGAFPDRPYDSKAVWGDDTKITTIMKKSTNSF